MSMAKRKALLDCNCGCGSDCKTGCCIPIDHSNPAYEPTGTPSNIPFTINAPNCSEMDGYTGEMFCGGAIPARPGPCGVCTSCISEETWNLGATRWLELGPMCNLDSCGIVVCLQIVCVDGTEPDLTLERCCQKFRLYIGSTTPLLDGIEQQQGPCTNYIVVKPTTCVCSEDPSVMPSLSFPLSLPFDCPTFYTGACAGKSTCCDSLLYCDLTGATVDV